MKTKTKTLKGKAKQIDYCEKCKKCGEITCGNDTINYKCFEKR
jgi:uncharacterized OB-fold protein